MPNLDDLAPSLNSLRSFLSRLSPRLSTDAPIGLLHRAKKRASEAEQSQ